MNNNGNDSKYDSEFCGSLPIHLINHIQPYGALLVIDKDTLKIVQASENIESVFGVPVHELVDTSLHQYLSSEIIENIKERFTIKLIDKVPGIWKIGDKQYLANEHIRGSMLLVELDLFEDRTGVSKSFVEVYKEIKLAMSLIQSSKSIREVAENCVKELKRISGFDKIMVYCFDKNWNGTVIGEAYEAGMESYMGITFPASDIPHQARLLYLNNPYRFIPDRDYSPVKIYPIINPVTNSFVDLSDCNLRSVASVHLEYLRNMNVQSSMSTRIMFGERLWGLIACHHRTAKHLDYEMRSVFEMLSNIVSAKITSLYNNDLHLFNIRTKEIFKSLVEFSYREGSIANALLSNDPSLLTLLNGAGAVVSNGSKVSSEGAVPGREQLRELLLWLHAKQLKQVYYTDSLSAEYEPAGEFKDVASGILVIPINNDDDEYAIVFRPEVVKVINWGGNPDERIQFEQGTKNYHPRRSFEKWQQLVQGSSAPWREEEIHIAENLRSFIYEFSN